MSKTAEEYNKEFNSMYGDHTPDLPVSKGAKHKESLLVQETCKENPDSFTSDLEEAAKDYAILPMDVGDGLVCIDKKKERAFIAGAKWMENQMPMPEDTVIFMKGVEEGRRLEREDREENKRKEDELPRFYGD